MNLHLKYEALSETHRQVCDELDNLKGAAIRDAMIIYKLEKRIEELKYAYRMFSHQAIILERDELKTANEWLNAVVRAHERTTEELKAKIAAEKASCHDLWKDREALREKVDKLKFWQKVSDEADMYAEKYEEACEEIKKLKETIIRIDARFAQAEKDTKDWEDSWNVVSKQLAEALERIKKLEFWQHVRKDAIKEMEERLAESRTAYKVVEDENIELQARLASYEKPVVTTTELMFVDEVALHASEVKYGKWIPQLLVTFHDGKLHSAEVLNK